MRQSHLTGIPQNDSQMERDLLNSNHMEQAIFSIIRLLECKGIATRAETLAYLEEARSRVERKLPHETEDEADYYFLNYVTDALKAS